MKKKVFNAITPDMLSHILGVNGEKYYYVKKVMVTYFFVQTCLQHGMIYERICITKCYEKCYRKIDKYQKTEVDDACLKTKHRKITILTSVMKY